MSGRPAAYEHYNTAKKALGKGNAVCHRAHDLSQQTESVLSRAKVLTCQIQPLRAALHDQLEILQTVTKLVVDEEDQMKHEFSITLKELDDRDGELNAILGTLKDIKLPPGLYENATDMQISRAQPEKSLFEFAHDAAVEALKGQLREVIDRMQENQENMTLYREHLDSMVHVLEATWSAVPQVSRLRSAHESAPVENLTSMPHSRASSSLSTIVLGYAKVQEEHIEEMAKLLFSLTEHYDHSSKLFKSEATLPIEELEELQTIVENDAHQLEDVLLELDDRVIDLEDDVSTVNTYVTECSKIYDRLHEAFQHFESFDVTGVTSSLMKVRKNRKDTSDRLDILRQQIEGLADHYLAFVHSYDALLVEIDRRVKYEMTIVKFQEQTQQTLARLAKDEEARREDFIHVHGDSLPGDIWQGIRDRPILHEANFGQNIMQTPRLPELYITRAKVRLGNRAV